MVNNDDDKYKHMNNLHPTTTHRVKTVMMPSLTLPLIGWAERWNERMMILVHRWDGTYCVYFTDWYTFLSSITLNKGQDVFSKKCQGLIGYVKGLNNLTRGDNSTSLAPIAGMEEKWLFLDGFWIRWCWEKRQIQVFRFWSMGTIVQIGIQVLKHGYDCSIRYSGFEAWVLQFTCFYLSEPYSMYIQLLCCVVVTS